jgi:hypothetical protein
MIFNKMVLGRSSDPAELIALGLGELTMAMICVSFQFTFC